MIIRSRAPMRISFGGGGTDFRPYYEKYGGAVLSSTINWHTYTTIEPKQDHNKIHVKTLDLGIDSEIGDRTIYDGKLDLVKAALNSMGVGDSGGYFFMHSDAPLKSGLGGSSAVVVSLIGAISHWIGLHMTKYEIADLACRI